MSSYKFEEDFLNDEYERAERFDEGEIRQTREYSDVVNRRTAIFDYLIAKYAMYIDDIETLLYEYENAFYDEMELEAMHFFREGYIAGQNERGGSLDYFPLPCERLKELRIERHMSQEQIAALLGVSMNIYPKYESGERDYTVSAVVKLAKLYGTTPDYLIGWSNER